MIKVLTCRRGAGVWLGGVGTVLGVYTRILETMHLREKILQNK